MTSTKKNTVTINATREEMVIISKFCSILRKEIFPFFEEKEMENLASFIDYMTNADELDNENFYPISGDGESTFFNDKTIFFNIE